jgi:hypothetical protein
MAGVRQAKRAAVAGGDTTRGPSMAPEEVQQNHRGKRGGKEGEGGGPTGAKLSFYVAFEGPLMEKWMECQIRKQT